MLWICSFGWWLFGEKSGGGCFNFKIMSLLPFPFCPISKYVFTGLNWQIPNSNSDISFLRRSIPQFFVILFLKFFQRQRDTKVRNLIPKRQGAPVKELKNFTIFRWCCRKKSYNFSLSASKKTLNEKLNKKQNFIIEKIV